MTFRMWGSSCIFVKLYVINIYERIQQQNAFNPGFNLLNCFLHMTYIENY